MMERKNVLPVKQVCREASGSSEKSIRKDVRIHLTAEVSPKAIIGEGTSIWNQAQVREDARIGKNCVIGKNVYIDFGVEIGDNCKIQNNCSAYHGAKIGDGVFLGPHCVITNDLYPRAVNPDGSIKGSADWKVYETRVGDGAALGAGTILVCGVTVGEWAMTGSGSVVTKDVAPHALVVGNPARQIGWVCKCGKRIDASDGATAECKSCGAKMVLSGKK